MSFNLLDRYIFKKFCKLKSIAVSLENDCMHDINLFLFTIAPLMFLKIISFDCFCSIIEQPTGRLGKPSSNSSLIELCVLPIKDLNFFEKSYSTCALPTKSRTVKYSLPTDFRKPLPNCCRKTVRLSVGLKNNTVSISGKSIPSLKISFNNVFGYYIEVRNTHKDKVPAEWIRKQTLVNAERYITEELKEYESKILGAEEKIHQLETQLFEQLVNWIATYIKHVQLNANLIAQLDCLTSFTQLAIDNKYVCPDLDESFDLEIKEGRHPVIEKQLPVGVPYISNDVYLDRETQQIIMITGPNMSGKSAILRQTALIVLMAQMGSFVPAESVRMGVVDKIFTRVGASDNISMGESTFMVEMNETASILNNISERSLVLLDEIGRGTSTYDGISIAWAISEYLHEHPNKPKTLFATHYHELNEMEVTFDRIQNFNVSVKELKDTVLFIRKLVKGGSAHSFGIHVAKMAGMPQIVIQKAQKLLKQLEKRHSSEELSGIKSANDELQLSFFNLDDPLLEDIKEEIMNIDINTLTPVEALMKLNEIKRMLIKK